MLSTPSSPSHAVRSSPSPCPRPSALANAYEALLEAKALLRGEQSSLTPTTGASFRSGVPVTSPLPMAAALDFAEQDGHRPHDTPPQAKQLRSSSSGSNGVTQSRIQISASAASTWQSGASPVMNIDSPAAQSPVEAALGRTSTSMSVQRRTGHHVQFHVPLPEPSEVQGLRSRMEQHPRRDSWSPQPRAPPNNRRSKFTTTAAAAAAEVDARTVELLQYLSYDEVQLLRDRLAQPSAVSGGTFRTMRSPSSCCNKDVHTHSTKPADSTEALAFYMEVPSVLLDVEAQLRSSQFFYAQLPCEEDVEVVEDTTALEKQHDSASGVNRRCALPSATPGNTTPSAKAESSVATTAVESSEDELTLSPITRQSLSASPVQHDNRHPYHHNTSGECETRSQVSTPRYHPRPASPAPAGPSILVSPQRPRERCRSPPTQQPVSLVGAFDEEASPPPPQQQEQRLRGSAHHRVSPSSSPTERAFYFSHSPPRRLSSAWCLDNFDVGRRLDSGSAARTFAAREKRSKVMVALKCVPKDAAAAGERVKRVMRTARLQMTAGRHCPHVVKLYTSFEDAQNTYLILEHAEGGDLASYAARQPQQRLPEPCVRHVVRQLALALAYLHSSEVVHGAVDPRHVLLMDDCTTVKLGSFTYAARQHWMAGGAECWACEGGAVDYKAPELLCNKGGGSKSDLWALGVLTYELLCGYLPFEHPCTAQAKRLICSGVMYLPRWVSATAKSFIGSLLCVDEAGRCSATEALQHPFLAAAGVSSTSGTRQARDSDGHTVEKHVRETDNSPSVPAGVAAHSNAYSWDGKPTGDSTLFSPFGAASATSLLPMAGCSSNADSMTMTSSPSFPSSPRSDSHGDARQAALSGDGGGLEDEDDQSGSLSTVSRVPVPSTNVTTTATTPYSFLNLALPSHSWRTPTQPYGAGHGSSLPSVVLTSPPPAPCRGGAEEGGGRRPLRRSSATSVVSLALSSRPSLTATLSDASASFLSTTCAPTGGAASLTGVEGPGSGLCASFQGPSRQAAAGTLSGSFLLSSDAARVPCSVSVSSLTAASPNMPTSERASALDVDVSATSSDRSPRVQLCRHDSTALLSAVVGSASGTRNRRGAEAVAPAEASRPAAETEGTTAAASAAASLLASELDKKDRRKTTTVVAKRKKKAASGPECAVRLEFDCLSDGEW